MTRQQLKNAQSALLILALILSSVGLIATIYGDGGSAQWGGRLFQILLPLLVPLTVIGFHNAAGRLTGHFRTIVVGSLLVMTLGLSISSLRMNQLLRTSNQILSRTIEATVDYARSQREPDGKQVLTFLSQEPATGAGRALWQHDTELNLLSVNFKALYKTLTQSKFRDNESVLVISDVNPAAFQVLNKKLENSHSIRVHEIKTDKPWVATGFIYSNLNADEGR